MARGTGRRPSPDDEKLARLRALAGEPAAQRRYAEQVLELARLPDTVRAALAVLAAHPGPALRGLLLHKYAWCAADSRKRDSGGAIRGLLLGALRPLATRDDLPLLERAAATYEFRYGEVAGDLRAAALLTLQQVDDTLAGFHCVRLLTDEYTSPESGEPALTSVRILAAQGQVLPLYGYAIGSGHTFSEVLAESLRSLAGLPASLLPALVERYRASDDEIVLLGLFDLLLAHDARADYLDVLFTFLRETGLLALYHSLVSTLVARRDPALLARLEGLLRDERDREKAALLRSALALR